MRSGLVRSAPVSALRDEFGASAARSVARRRRRRELRRNRRVALGVTAAVIVSSVFGAAQIPAWWHVGSAQAVNAPKAAAAHRPAVEARQVSNGPVLVAQPQHDWTAANLPYGDLIVQAAQRERLDPLLLGALIHQESGFQAGAVSSAGAVGLTQLMPATARWLGVSDPRDPAQAIAGGARYLSAQLAGFDGAETLALAAYNAGPGAVQRYGGVPPYPQTRRYVTAILAKRDSYRRQAGLP